jgi:hypothetical protein
MKYLISKDYVQWSRVLPCGRTDGHTNKYDEANSNFLQFKNTHKMQNFLILQHVIHTLNG